MYSVYIYEGELPCLTTDNKKDALEYWCKNNRKIIGNVGVLDKVNNKWIA